jgi:hypothetical protein
MKPVEKDETPLFAQLIEERGFDPLDLSTEIAAQITSAVKAREKLLRDHIQHIARDAAQ